ncbi:unnamed protein product [Chironomus riparius]|uniref:Ionotropic glutamate receptor C-terminal domain-containing protein n=1 Tax=Chironomus riparius TaxID=315576 RepID=A0A9N9X1Q9_9DIPT|nr:unnamed protein product [Chironomus riparius]
MKLRIFLISAYCWIFCESILNHFDKNKDVHIITNVLHEVADEYLLKEDNQLNIVTIETKSQLLMEVSRNFVGKAKEKFSFQTIHHKSFLLNSNSTLASSSFLFMERTSTLRDIEHFYEIERKQNLPIKYFAFISDLTYDELKTSNIYKFYMRIPMMKSAIFLYTYFITNDVDTVTLSTVEWFSPYRCNRAHLTKLNSFDKKTKKWNSKLKYSEKFMNYYKCELVMMLPVPQREGSLHHVSGYAFVNNEQTGFEIHGVSPVIVEIASKFHNFTSGYQPVFMRPKWLRSFHPEPINPVLINKSFKYSNIYFEIAPIDVVNTELRISKVVANLNGYMLVTPGERFTPYEKFLLPFDATTWIFLAITFLVTFVVIFIVNYLTLHVQQIVYGNNVKTPTLNVVRIFFGMAQMRLPNENFSRLILVIFVYFCLIFRTCFQSKFFEFMTSEPRQPPPRTITDLIDKNFSVYATSSNIAAAGGIFRIEKWPNITEVTEKYFNYAYLTQSQNASARMALATDEFYMNFFDLQKKKRIHDWKKLEYTTLWSSYDVFIFHGTAFYFRMLFKIIDSLIPTGIMHHLIQEHFTKKFKFQKVQKIPRILNVNDLLFGFNIWLGFCVISFIGFVLEILTKLLKKPKKMKYAKIHPSFEDKEIEVFTTISPDLIKNFKTKKYQQTEKEVFEENQKTNENNKFEDDNIEDLILEYLLKTSVFLFFESLENYGEIEKLYQVVRNYNQPIKYFAFIPNLTFDKLNSSNIFEIYGRIPIFANAIFPHAYFITNEVDTVTLSTVEWFSPHGCNHPYLHKLNVFDKKSQKWNSKLKNYEKFLNYHNCELVMMLPIPFGDGSVYHVSGYSIPNQALTNFEIRGITPKIFEIAAQYHNFNAEYQPVLIEDNWMLNRQRHIPKIIGINGSAKEIDVYFEIAPVNSVNTGLRISNVVTNLNVWMFVTPAEKYSPYEKFFLPFDLPTWVLLLITFLMTFVSIFIINQLSKSVQNLIYGQNIETPIWNVISIFFGISQTKLPSKNFSRFILTIFVYFCLIFRTCFQSKFFEFMTSEPRQPPPKSIEDLIDRNYTVYALKATLYLSQTKEHKKIQLNIQEANVQFFSTAFLTQSQNSSAKIALSVDDYFLNYHDSLSRERNYEWNKIDNFVFYTTQDVFLFHANAYYFHVTTEFMANANENFAYNLRSFKVNDINNLYILTNPSFLFFDSLNKFEYIEQVIDVIHLRNQQIKHFVFIPNLSFKELQYSSIFESYDRIPLHRNAVFMYTYFITNEIKTVTLSTVEWFSSYGCNRPHLHKINFYNKKSRSWNKKLKDYEKFRNFHNCELVMMLPTPLDDGTLYYVSGFALPNQQHTNFEIHGISTVIFEIMSPLHNFTATYQPANIRPDWIKLIETIPPELVMINETIKEPDIYFEISPLIVFHNRLQISKVVTNLDILMYVTPGEKYTPYEKLFLPFDMLTWTLLVVFFLITFLTILFINQMPKSVKYLVYGYNVTTPTINVIRIFFGISQTKLPDKKFSMFLFIIFVYFCLIFRTCFQSKFFEYMTSEPRKPSPKSIGDLIDRNYRVYSMRATRDAASDINRVERWPDIIELDAHFFLDALLKQSQNASAKMALAVDDYFLNHIESQVKNKSYEWKKLKNVVLFRTYDVFIFHGAACYARILDNLINNLVATGIMKQLIENFYTKKWNFAIVKDLPQVLSVDDLSFGFNIWLVFCLVTIFTFLGEILCKFIRKTRKTKKINFAKVHPDSKHCNQINRILKPELIVKFRTDSKHKVDDSEASGTEITNTKI